MYNFLSITARELFIIIDVTVMKSYFFSYVQLTFGVQLKEFVFRQAPS